MKFCQHCFERIPEERVKALPDTNHCVKHSQEQAYFGLPCFSHKTAPELIKTKGSNEEGVRLMRRAYNRSR